MYEPVRKLGAHNGLGDPGISRYLALYIAQLGWLAVGLWLFRASQWPSTCQPSGLIELFACSSRLPESGRWLDGAMMTWLWITPLLILLEIARRFGGSEDEPQEVIGER